MQRSGRFGAAPIAALALMACSSPGGQNTASLGVGPGGIEVVFLAQSARPNAFMEALFQGRVVVDAAGCLRLDGPDPVTVVWPYRSRMDWNRLRVLDSLGVEIGRIGGSFRLGGGEGALHDGLALSEQDRELAASRCPGRFWIVGEVP